MANSRAKKKANRFKYDSVTKKINSDIKRPYYKVDMSSRECVISETESTTKYNVTNHCVFRYMERVVGLDKLFHLTDEEILSTAKHILELSKSNPSCLFDGKYPFLDGFKIVVRGGKFITIIKETK